MELKQGYKQTEVGIIPEDWAIETLGEIIKLKNGYAFSSDNYTEKGDLILITPGNFKIDGGLSFTTKNTLRYSGFWKKEQAFEHGDLLLVMTDLTPDCNLLGKSGIVKTNETILHNQRIGKLVPKVKNISKEYLMYYFNSERFSRRMKNTATGSTVRHTSVPTINKTILPLPPLPEQTAIANVLSDMDVLMSQTEKFIKKKKAIKQGAMQELLKPKDGWVTKKLGELVSVIKSGGTPLTSIKEYYNGEIPFLSISDMTSQGKYLHRTSSKISQNGLDNSSSWLVQKESLIYSMYASVGFVSLNKIDIAISQAVLGMKFKDIMNLEFMYYTLLNMQKSVLKFVGEGTQKNLNAASVNQFDIKYPSIFEQEAIADILSNMDSDIDLQIKKLTKLKQQKQGMMQALLTGKIRLA
jgi:type I restriction enzyme S subunit